MRKLITLIAIVAIFAGCEPSSTAEDKEKKTQENNYTSLQAKQPAEVMDYSPTREGLNYWMETWGEQKKISYVYLLASNGQKIGYYVFEGLPISYCASLTPTENVKESDYDSGMVTTTAPSMDGVYYSGSQCLQYFGRDALTGSYIEFSIGSGINFLVYEQPLPQPDVEALGFTTIEEVQEAQK